MTRNKKFLGVRLGVEGGGKFKADMRGIGSAGQNSLRKIENSARAATPELLVMNKAAGGLNNILRQGAGLLTAYLSISTLMSSVSQFATFEQGLVGVGKTTNIVGAELQSLGDEIDALSRRIPVVAEGLLDIAQSAGQLGVQGSQNILLFTDTMAKMESATDLAGSEAAKSLQRILNVTGEATDNIDNLSAAIVALGNSMAASESEIVGQAQEIVKAGTAYGITSKQAVGLGAATAAMGIQAELAGSTVTRAFLAIDDAIARGGNKIRLLSDLTGIAAEDLRQAFGDNAVQVFEKFLQGLNRVDKSGGRISDTLSKFGLNSVRVLKTLPPMALRVDDVTTAMALSNKAFFENIALNKEAAAAWDTTQSAGQVLANTMGSLSRGFAGGFNAELRQSTDDVKKLVEETIPAARALGEDFAPAVAFASKALVTLVENGGTVITVLGGLVIARASAAAFGLLAKSLIGNAGAIIGLRAMIAVSPVAAAQMVATAGAARILSASLALIGGPVGAAVLAAGGLIYLITRQSEASKAAEEHHKFLKMLNDELDRENKTLKDLHLEKVKGLELRKRETEQVLLNLEYQLRLAQNQGVSRQNPNFAGVGKFSKISGLKEEIEETQMLLDKMEATLDRLILSEKKKTTGSGSSHNPANDNLALVNIRSFATLDARNAAAMAALKNAGELQNVKVISQTMAQYEKARAAIGSTLAKMEIDALRATGKITEVIRREADAQIAIWHKRAAAGVATEQDMFRAIVLINEQAARDVDEYRREMNVGLQAGKDAAQTFTESLIAAGATSGSVLDQLGRSFRTTMLKMVSDAFLLKPIQSIFSTIFSSIAAFMPGSGAAPTHAAVGGPYADGAAFANGNVIPFASGGVFDTPQFFPMSAGRVGLFAEAGPEAIMPLSRGRDGKLGVQASGAAPVVNVNVIGAPPGTETRKRQRADGGFDVDVIIPRAVAGDILGGGDVSDALETRYGLVPGGV